MKKFSTNVPFLASTTLVAALLGSLTCLPALAREEVSTQKANCRFLANAPDQHIVVQHDTLWGISEMFLEHAWCWPQVWEMNSQEIKNPHWIYPGQVVYFDRAAGRLRLGKSIKDGRGAPDIGSSNLPTVKLSPQIRAESLTSNAITAIPANVIEPFLSQPLVLQENDLQGTPRIISAQQGHVNIGKSEKAYAMGDLHGGTNFQVYRPSTPLIDPQTNKILGYESMYVGRVKLTRAGKGPNEAHSFLVTNSKEEMTPGDRLLPVPNIELNNYVPHPPTSDVAGRIVSIYGGVAQAGKNQTVSVNLGSNEGMDIGTVLKMYRLGDVIVDRTKKEKIAVKLPDEEYGTLFLYHVFRNVSYGLIMNVTDSAQVGDIVRSPE